MVAEIECVNEQGDIRRVTKEEIVFAYRATRLPGEPGERLLLTRGIFVLERADQAQLVERCRDIITRRRRMQPTGVGSAGSFFKNPKGDFAGRLIEQAGLKGLIRGKAMVSPKHANFIVNTGGAEPEDIIQLMQEVRRRVFAQSGVLLEPEVHIL
jgi:UDP-N-acetylmuramate dehydrogenase